MVSTRYRPTSERLTLIENKRHVILRRFVPHLAGNPPTDQRLGALASGPGTLGIPHERVLPRPALGDRLEIRDGDTARPALLLGAGALSACLLRMHPTEVVKCLEIVAQRECLRPCLHGLAMFLGVRVTCRKCQQRSGDADVDLLACILPN